jgi:molybdate transport system substrate-binding protein
VTGDVSAGPVAKYAKSALEKLGAWSAVKSKFARAENVRAALLLVARNEAALGIVYATDAKIGTRREDCRHFPGELAAADYLSVRSDDHRFGRRIRPRKMGGLSAR